MIVLTLMLVLAFTVGAYFFLVSGEGDRTAARSHEIQAAVIGEGVANRVTTIINRWPWSARFHAKLGSPGGYAFTEQKFPFGKGDVFAKIPEVTFRGSLKDLPQPLSYRLVVEVTCAGAKVLMLWDKQHSTSLLSAASDDGTVVSQHPDGTPESALDALADLVKGTSRKNRPLGAIPLDLAGVVDAAILDRQAGTNPAKAILGGP